MANILILGGGFGGVIAAETLAKEVGKEHQITLVSRSPKFIFYPELVRLAFGNFEEIVKPSERKEILSKLLKRFPLLTPVESAIAKDGSPLEVIVFRIRIDRITGVSEG